jgi:hypothetical protein
VISVTSLASTIELHNSNGERWRVEEGMSNVYGVGDSGSGRSKLFLKEVVTCLIQL